jgi:hypothetical protein
MDHIVVKGRSRALALVQAIEAYIIPASAVAAIELLVHVMYVVV